MHERKVDDEENRRTYCCQVWISVVGESPDDVRDVVMTSGAARDRKGIKVRG